MDGIGRSTVDPVQIDLPVCGPMGGVGNRRWHQTDIRGSRNRVTGAIFSDNLKRGILSRGYARHCVRREGGIGQRGDGTPSPIEILFLDDSAVALFVAGSVQVKSTVLPELVLALRLGGPIRERSKLKYALEAGRCWRPDNRWSPPPATKR